MRVLIAGGTGLIGRALSSSLVADGHEVIVLTRDPARIKAGMAGVRYVQWDAKTAAGWGELADGAGALVNLAGEGIADGRWNDKRKEAIILSRKEAGAAMMDALRQASVKPKVLIQSSAVGYYGPRKDGTPVTESAPPAADWLGRVVFAWEASTAAAEALGVRRPVIRTGIVFSTAGGAFPKMKLPFDM
ncbi:MAG: NAD-dependent epimerase/dehydratase family protein, partial [Caldilineaceae bacterium]